MLCGRTFLKATSETTTRTKMIFHIELAPEIVCQEKGLCQMSPKELEELGQQLKDCL